MPAKILFTIPNFTTAGAGQALVNIVRRLDRDRFAPSICVLKAGGRLEATVHELGIPLLVMDFVVAPRPLPGLARRLWRAARAFRPYGFALWHSYHYADDYTEPLIARLAGARGWIYTKKNMSWGGRAWKLRTYLASRVVAQNTAMLKRFFAAPRVRAKTRLLPRGVDTQKFRPAVKPRLALRERFAISPETPLVGCVAHLLPVKGHTTLIEALAHVPGAHLILAGKPLDKQYAESLIGQCATLAIPERVHFLDEVTDVPALNAELDIFVLPTLAKQRMEGCPVALLEGMACGLPCIATDIPGSQDIIEPERSGLLIPPEDSAALAGALRRLIEAPELRKRLGEAARKRIIARYTIEREVKAHEALYAELLDGNT